MTKSTPKKGSTSAVTLDSDNLDAVTQQLQELQSNLETLRAEVALAPSPPHVSPAPSPSVKEPKMADPDFFEGDRTKAQAFLLQLCLVFRAQPSRYGSGEAKVAYAASRLHGTALSWFTPFFLKDDEPLTHDFAEFSKELLSAFGDPDREANAERELTRITKGNRPAATMAADFRWLMAETRWNDNALMHAFYRALNDDVKDELCKRDRPETLAALMEVAIRIDNCLFKCRQERKHAAGVASP